MKTSELISMLASGPVAAGGHVTERRLGAAVAAGAVLSAALVALLLGPRQDMAAAVLLPGFWIKLAFPVGLAMAALAATCRLARPGMALGSAGWFLATPLLVVVALGVAGVLAAPAGSRGALVQGHSAMACLASIVLLALPVGGLTLMALRTLAPTRPSVAGACAGLLAGAVAASVYAFHCDEMAAPFIAVWYLLGIAVPTAIAAALGPRLLRWA
ncbi:MAG: DUF1109 domain-containing protein [Caldimonas sp.]